jgi:hypothetical protein
LVDELKVDLSDIRNAVMEIDFKESPQVGRQSVTNAADVCSIGRDEPVPIVEIQVLVMLLCEPTHAAIVRAPGPEFDQALGKQKGLGESPGLLDSGFVSL